MVFDAFVVQSFGGPRGPGDVTGFLRNVTAGRAIPQARIDEVAAHYLARGGVSPIVAANDALVAALRRELDARGVRTPVVLGNRNWDPYLSDVLRELSEQGHRRVRVVSTSAYSGYSGCRQYQQDLQRAVAAVPADGALAEVSRVGPYFDHPGFVAANAAALSRALAECPDPRPRVLFVTHSIPVGMQRLSAPPGGVGYLEQHRRLAAELIAATAPDLSWDLVFCSRSGPPTVPWLEPDIADHLPAVAGSGVGAVVVAPIGFTSDHMEVVQDLDTVAARVARDNGLGFVRAATAGTSPAFVGMLADLLCSEVPARCGTDCCARGGERPKEER